MNEINSAKSAPAFERAEEDLPERFDIISYEAHRPSLKIRPSVASSSVCRKDPAPVFSQPIGGKPWVHSLNRHLRRY